MHVAHSRLGFFGFDYLSDGIFEPLAAAVLLFFGIYYYWVVKQKKVSIKKVVTIGGPVTILFIFFGTIILLLTALSIFVWLAARSKDIRSFQFQISVFIIIWVLGGVVYILHDSRIIVASPLQGNVGLEIIVVSLVFFSIMVWLRFYYSQEKEQGC